MKGRTRWFPRDIEPVRVGNYECYARLAGGARVVTVLRWDMKGFLVPFPLVVLEWRGMTKKAHDAAMKEADHG